MYTYMTYRTLLTAIHPSSTRRAEKIDLPELLALWGRTWAPLHCLAGGLLRSQSPHLARWRSKNATDPADPGRSDSASRFSWAESGQAGPDAQRLHLADARLALSVPEIQPWSGVGVLHGLHECILSIHTYKNTDTDTIRMYTRTHVNVWAALEYTGVHESKCGRG